MNVTATPAPNTVALLASLARTTNRVGIQTVHGGRLVGFVVLVSPRHNLLVFRSSETGRTGRIKLDAVILATNFGPSPEHGC